MKKNRRLSKAEWRALRKKKQEIKAAPRKQVFGDIKINYGGGYCDPDSAWLSAMMLMLMLRRRMRRPRVLPPEIVGGR